MTLPCVAIVVVAFGHATDLPALLASVAALDYPTDRLELIVVDNGDGSDAAVVRALATGAQVVEPGANLGFAAGCNLGVSRTSADVIILANPDTGFAPTAVRALCAAL